MKPEDKYSNSTYNRPDYSPSFVASPVTVAPGVDVTPVVSVPVAKTADDSLNQNYIGSSYDSSLETPNVGMTPTFSNIPTGMSPLNSKPSVHVERFSAFRFNRTASLITLAVVVFILLVGIGSFMFNSFGSKSSTTSTTQSSGQPSTHFGISSLPIQDLSASSNLQVGVNQLSVNGQLQVNDTIVLSPTVAPSSPVAGQIYYDQGSNTPYFYNGTRFVSLDPTHVNSLGGSTGDIGLGQGLQITGNQLSISSTLLQSMINSAPSTTSTGVTSLTGTTNQINVSSPNGNVTLSLPQDINSTALPTFTGTTLGLAGTTSGSLIFANSSNVHTTTLQGLSSGTQNQTITIPASTATTDTICLVTLGNCSSSGVTTSGGIQNYITKYNNVGATQLGNSLLFDNGISIGLGNNAPSASYVLDVTGNVHNTGNSVVGGNLNVLGNGGITVGVAGSVAGGVTFASNTSTQLGTLKMISPSGVGNATFNIPSIVGGTTDTVCLLTLANCSGAGNSVTTTGGTINALPKFSSAQGLSNSSITDNGTTVTVSNVLSAATFTASLIQSTGAISITPSGNLTIGASNQILALQGNGNTSLSATAGGFTSTLGFTTPTASRTINLPNESGTVCLQSSVSCGFAMAGSGVTTLNGLAGALSIANATGLGSTVTIQDASTAQKGIAQFNASDFTATAGVIDTIQSITTTSALQFASLGLGTTSTSGNLTLGATGILVANNLSHTGAGHNINIDAGADNIGFSNSSGTNTFLFPTTGGLGQVICTSGITCASGGGQAVILEPSGVQTSNSNLDSIFINRASGTGNLVKLQAGGLNAFVINSTGNTTISNTTTIAALQTNSITPTAALTIGSNAQTMTLQGNLSSQFTATDPSTFTTSIGFSRKAPYTAPTGNVAYNFENDSNIAPGSYYVCTTVGNCAGVGGSVTTTGGTSGTIAMFTSSGNIADSLLTQASTTVSVGGNLAVGVANAGVTDYGLIFNNHTTVNTVTLQLSAAPAASATILVPNVSGTVAVSAAGPLSLNATTGALTCPTCLTSGGGGGTSGVTSVDALSGVLTINNTTGSGSAITIDNASTTVKGIAQFNSTNFTASAGAINTIQDIATTSNPTFANLTVQGVTGLTVGSAANLGQLLFKDGTVDGFTATFSPATLTASRLLTIPNAAGTLAVSASGNLALSATGNVTISNNPTFTTSVTTPAILGSGTLTVDANGASALSLNSTGTGDILLGGGSGSTGCTVTNATGALACTSTINGATLSGGTLTATAVNTLNVSGTAISGTGTLTVDANGANNLSLGGIGTGDILLGGGSGSTGCTITNSTGSLTCTANLQGATLSATAANGLTLGTASSLTGGIIFKGSGGAGTLTVAGPTTPNAGNYTLTIPAITANANVCTDNAVCAGYAAGSGSGAYIQNQIASQQSSSNFWISGTGRADTALQTPAINGTTTLTLQSNTTNAITLDSGTTGTINIGTNANAKTINLGPVGSTVAADTLAIATSTGAAQNIDIGGTGTGSATSNAATAITLQGGATVLNVVNAGANVVTYTNSTTGFQVLNSSSVGVLTVDTTTGAQQTILQSSGTDAVLAAASVDTASAVQDLNTANWTSTNWTTAANSATHVTGNTSALVNTGFTPTIGTTYQVSYTYTLCTSANTLGITFGGQTLESTTSCVGTNTKVVTATGTGQLTFTPNSTYIGVVSGVKIQALSTQVKTALTVKNSSGTATLEVRSSGDISNVFIGLNSGKNNTSSGVSNTALGTNTLQSNTTGNSNAAIGYNALQSNTTGHYNTATGSQALQSNTTGNNNTANGLQALFSNTTGNYNTANGQGALMFNTTGSQNTANGTTALFYNTTGNHNTATGYNALISNTTGNDNTSSGYQALQANSIGSDNTAIGYLALYRLKTLTGTISATVTNGGNAQFTSTSTTGLIAGAAVTVSGTTSYNGSKTILTVDDATHFTISTAFSTADATGSWTTASTDGNTALGSGAGFGTNSYTAVGGTYVGYNTGLSLQTGANYNTLLGYSAGSGITTGSGNVLLGKNAGTTLTTGSNNVGIGQGVAFASNTGSNQLQIGAGISGDLSLGTLNIKTVTNSTTGFQVQNSSAVSVLNVDTTNLRVGVGSIGTATGQLYVAGLLPSATLGSVATGTNPYYFAVQGKYAYIVNNGSNTLRIVDISVPSSPAAVSSVATFTSPYSVVVSGKYAYVTNNGDATHGLQIFDISNPTSPVSVGTATTGTGPRTLAVQGRYVFVLNATANTIQSFDVSNPTLPIALTTQATGSNPVGISVSGRYAYVTNNSGPSFTIFDISNPSSIPAGTTTSTTTAGPNPIYVQGRYAYLVASNSASAFQIWDISNPTTPAQTGSTTAGASPNGLYVQGRYAYVIYNGGNFQIFDISNPAAPSSIGTYATGLTTPTGINVSGRYAYVTSSTGLVSFDLGGTYTQQLEAGGIETGTLQVNNAANFNNSVSIAAGLQVGQSLQVSGNIGSSGSVLFQNATNSTTAAQVQNAAGTVVLDVDTSNARVGIGTNAPTADLSFGSGASRTINVIAPSTNVAGSSLTISAGSGGAGATGVAGSNLVLSAGSAAGTTGAAAGGNAIVKFSAGINGGAAGNFTIQDSSGNNFFQFDTASATGNPNAFGTLTCGMFFSNSCAIKGGAGLVLLAGQATSAININPGTNGALVKPQANTTTAFQVQNAAGTAIFTTDSTNSQAVLGTSNSINGQLQVLNATNANTITIVAGATSASYSLTLPTAGPTVSQCLQSDATTASLLKFSACSNAHTKKIVLTAEYAGAVLDPGTGANNSGTMTSAIDLTNRENYYKWVTTQATSQSYDVDIQVPVPSDFSSWGGTPVSIDTYTTDTTNGTLQAEARDTTGGVETGCNFVAITPSANNAWQTKTGCTIAGTYTAGGYMTLRLRMYATSAVTAVRVGNITLSYNSAY